jgi:hypothetical protein
LGARVGIVAKACGKSSARRRLHGGRGRGVLRGARLCAEFLLPREVALLRPLLALEQTLLDLQRALRLAALRLSRLHLLHTLLQAIDPGLALGILPR